MLNYDVIIRLDAGGSVGLGHLRRCLALAKAFRRRKVHTAFMTRNAAFVRQWTGDHFPVIAIEGRDLAAEIPELCRFFSKFPPRLFILDHYEYKPAHLHSFSKCIGAIAYVDDMGRWKDYPVDAIINHNVDAGRLPYPKKGPKLFLGTSYSLMAEEMNTFRRKKKKRDSLQLFMTLGGGAEKKDIRRLLNAFAMLRKKIKNARAFVAPGLGWKDSKPQQGIQWVKPHQFLQAMSRCNLAVSSSGVTSYELACLGIPSVLLTAAGNQAGICREMARRKCAVNGGWLRKASAEKISRQVLKLWKNQNLRKAMERRQKKLVGTRGPEKLAKALQKELMT